MQSTVIRNSKRSCVRFAAAIAVTSGVVLAGFGPAQAVPFALPDLGSSAFGSSGFGSSDEVVADAPRLASVDNFRDVAGVGSGYSLSGGKHMNKGVVYRSNVLRPNEADLATLAALGLSAVYDLRTPDAVAEDPDILPAGARYTNIDIFGRDLETEGAQSIRSAADARAFMESMNRGFVGNEHERGAFAQLFTELANTPGPVLFHCNSGKDRTGWAAAILQGIAGADRATIMQDYMLTNEYSAETIKKKNEKLLAAVGAERAAWYAPMMGVEKSYLEAGFAALDAEYGTVDNYLTEGLGLDADIIARLKSKLGA
ncbi:tyrosine-protein phosphatase [Rhodococcus daqingensis]|uniref:Tyrosine-protein phosphatase n=1 Tax=Rhodococcus daqingensis TaxID=2479363 RepID=A0ABW2S4Q1_9NOCA